MYKAVDVAKVFLMLSKPEEGDVLTNLKLQKLLYYAQGFHIAIYGKLLFEEPLLRWEHGPVVREVYDVYKRAGSDPLPVPEDFDPEDVFTSKDLEFIAEINEVYGQFSAWKLRDMTHEESPWLETSPNQIIDPELLRRFFLTRVGNG